MTSVKNLLPIGSVVLVKGANKKMMIIGVKIKAGKDSYDYMSVLFPEGYSDPDHSFLFNHEDIESVSFIGYVNSEQQLFKEALIKEFEGKLDKNK